MSRDESFRSPYLFSYDSNKSFSVIYFVESISKKTVKSHVNLPRYYVYRFIVQRNKIHIGKLFC